MTDAGLDALDEEALQDRWPQELAMTVITDSATTRFSEFGITIRQNTPR